MKKEQVDQMTLQEACDYAVLKIVEQGGRCGYCSGGTFYCEYGNESGKHCAVGWLLDEDNVDLMQNGVALITLTDEYGSAIPDLIRENLDTFQQLQEFHDADFKGYRRQKLRCLSQRGVDTSAPQYQQWVEMGDEG